MEEKVRIRLSFEDRKLLTKSQRSQGLQSCWMLLRSDHHTISHFSSSIISTFDLDRKCPNGLILSMDDFVLPPLETTCILKDKDIIRVRKKAVKCEIKIKEHANEMETPTVKGKEPEYQSDDHLVVNQSCREHSHHGEMENAGCQLARPNDLAGLSRKISSLKRKRQSNGDHHLSKNDKLVSSQGCGEEIPVTDIVKKTPSRNARRKRDKRKWLHEHVLLRKNQAHDCSDTPACQMAEENTCSEDEIVPVVIRPGHIRFQSRGKISDAELSTKLKHDVITCPWESKTSDKSQKETSVEEEQMVPPIDFESLFPLTCFPKVGDVVAYKLVDFSSSYPEFSDFRVGQVSSFDPDSMKAILVPVPGHPISIGKAFSSHPNLSPYKEDGSLEIDFMSLIDVRLVRKQVSDMTTANIRSKACNGEVGQSSTWDLTFRRGSSQGNVNASSIDHWSSGKWDSLLSGSSTLTTKVASQDAENTLTQGRDWDKIKGAGTKEADTSLDGWPQWKSREYLANTSWSFLLRDPPPRPGKKRRTNNDDNFEPPRKNNRYKS